MPSLNGMGVCQIANSAPAQAANLKRVVAAANTNLTSVNGGPCVLCSAILCNNTASAKFFKLYDKAIAPVLASDTPVATLIIPANGTLIIDLAVGFGFSNGLAYAMTGAIGDTDTTNLAANDVHGVLGWK